MIATSTACSAAARGRLGVSAEERLGDRSEHARPEGVRAFQASYPSLDPFERYAATVSVQKSFLYGVGCNFLAVMLAGSTSAGQICNAKAVWRKKGGM